MKALFALLLSIMITSFTEAETFSISYENGRIIRRYPEGTQPVIGLALSGGGARGIAQIGVLQVLEEEGIHVERIAGTSMGSIVGGLYAAGYSPSALADITDNIDWTEAFGSTPRRRSIYIGEKTASEWPLFELRFNGFRAQIPSSLLSGQRVSIILSWLTLGPTYECERDFDRLSIPFRSVTTDLNTGQKVIIGYGNLGRAIQASSTIPLLFSPVEWGNMLLVDGGLMDNLPISTVREMGSDFVIAVAIEESMHPAQELHNPLNVADNATSILMSNITRLSKSQADFVISPNMESFSSTDFSNIPEMIEQGRQPTLAAIPALKDSLARKILRYRKTYIHSISVSPPDNEEFALNLLSNYVTSNHENLLADIVKGLEMLWSTERYYTITATLDDNTGNLHIDLIELPESLTILVNSQNNNENTNIKLEFSTRVNEYPSMEFVIAKIDSLVHSIRSKGYSFAHVASGEIHNENDGLTIGITTPRLTRILLDEGLTSRRSLIMREFEIKEGEIFDLGKVMRTVDNLYGTNLFEWVYTDVESYNGGVSLRVLLNEKNWTVARFGLHYDETFNTEGRLTLTRENILGFGNQLTATAHSGQYKKLMMIENRNNRIYNTLYTFSIKMYKQYWKRPFYQDDEYSHDYEDNRYGIVFSVGQQMDKLGNALLQFKSETLRIRVAPFKGVKSTNKELRSLAIRSLIDSYDRYPFPNNGFINIIYIENASEIFGGTEQFVKIFWGNSFVRTYARKHTLGGSFMVGTADPSIPDIEAFTLGGDASRLNCYDPDTANSHYYADFLGLADEGKRGTRLVVGKLSYRLFIPRAFYLSAIYSLGNVWEQGVAITSRSLLHSFGITGSFATYAGPLSFGWGNTSEGDDRYYISAGWEF